ncbi:glycoside hydrolase family 172 protein [uncultured Salegentibacter sp.]|uniref:glycoside hydrolase family 172 protein n=1 Tax=uncultured Salegentibacter sp. TaxID=259320 RepID=UPI0030D6EE7F
MKNLFALLFSVLLASTLTSQEEFNGLELNLGNIYRVSDAETRSISPENFTGEPGKAGMATEGTGSEPARELGQGWKVSPSVKIGPGETFTMAEVNDQGVIQHMWMTPTGNWRHTIMRIYWDGEEEPSVEVPVGDFFGMGWGEYAPLNSQPITVNPGSAFNSFWPMPFRKKFKITMENMSEQEMYLYYQIDYALTNVPEDAAYFHAQFRRSNPTEGAIHTLVDGIKGKGHYVGTYMAWQVNNRGWWGEGEIKFYMDGDKKFPTIAGTGTEDYFLGSYNFENKKTSEYERYSTPYAGLHQIIRPDGLYNSQQRFGLYRWHIQDPIRFQKDLKITIQDLGWRSGHRYLQQKSDISSVVYWYQLEPHASFPDLPSKDNLEVN